jgi:hypothetical protein
VGVLAQREGRGGAGSPTPRRPQDATIGRGPVLPARGLLDALQLPECLLAELDLHLAAELSQRFDQPAGAVIGAGASEVDRVQLLGGWREVPIPASRRAPGWMRWHGDRVGVAVRCRWRSARALGQARDHGRDREHQPAGGPLVSGARLPQPAAQDDRQGSSPAMFLETTARTGNYDWKLRFKLETGLSGDSSAWRRWRSARNSRPLVPVDQSRAAKS